MGQQSFTPSGVEAKLTELYALDDTQLGAEADAVLSDFTTWINDNFSLDTTQATFLSGMDSQFLDNAAYMTSFSLRNRLEITLTVTGTPPGPNDLKLIHLSNDIETTDSSSGFAVTGKLYYNVEYQ